MIKKILVASDGSSPAMEAARAAARIAGAFDAELTVVTVANIPRMYKVDLGDEMERAYIEDWEHALKDTVRAIGDVVKPRAKLLREDSPAEAILAEAESGGYDLIVVGSTGAGNPGERAMGSVAARVGAGAHCSVLVIR
ncbi:MAG: universal stress protein [bacterium]|jgi:nucleotide-binding universal stress UspA family protein